MKKSKNVPEKKKSAREKIQKSAREKKNPPEKKTKKVPKNGFSLFIWSGKKKSTGIMRLANHSHTFLDFIGMTPFLVFKKFA